jgi:hypothetical protein
VVFSDFVRQAEVAVHQFGENEGIKSIASAFNGKVAVAGTYTIRMFTVDRKEAKKVSVAPIDKVLRMGSVKERQAGRIPAVKEVLFDGERCITNNGAFIRVYDFYTGKSISEG